ARPGAAAASLWERDAELAVVTEAVDALRHDGAPTGSGNLLVFGGEAGIGKTALLAETRRIAEQRGCTVWSARGGETVTSVPFHVVRQLLKPGLLGLEPEEARGYLGDAYEIAGPALGVTEPGEGQADPQGVCDGLVEAASRLAKLEWPLVLIVDDAHWADQETLHWLASFCRPVRPASSPAGTGALSFGAHPGPNSTVIRLSSTANSERDSASACRRSPAFCARYIGITQHSRPVACPKAFVATFEPRIPAPRNSGSTVCATVDCDTPSHRPSSAAQIDVSKSLRTSAFAVSTTDASRAPSDAPASAGDDTSARTAASSRARIVFDSWSGLPSSSRATGPACAGTDRSRRRDAPPTNSVRGCGNTAADAAAALIDPPGRTRKRSSRQLYAGRLWTDPEQR
ncbi:ATP-binding protein, partial [Streptomyces sp. NPDC004290]